MLASTTIFSPGEVKESKEVKTLPIVRVEGERVKRKKQVMVDAIAAALANQVSDIKYVPEKNKHNKRLALQSPHVRAPHILKFLNHYAPHFDEAILVIMYILIERIMFATPEIFSQVSLGYWILAALRIADKGYEDCTLNADDFVLLTEKSRFPVTKRDLYRLESSFCFYTNFDVSCTEQEYFTYEKSLLLFSKNKGKGTHDNVIEVGMKPGNKK